MEKKQEEINQGLKLLAKSSVIVFIGLFLSKVFSYVYRIIIARYFGPELYGIFSLALMVVGWFIAISSLGFSMGLARYIPFYRGKKEFEKIKYILKFSTTILFFSSIFAGAILFFSSNFIAIKIFHNSDLIIFLKIFSFLIPVAIFTDVFLNILRAFEKIAWHSFIFNILSSIIKVMTIVLFILIGIKSNSIIFSYFLGFLAMLFVSFIVCKYKIPKIFEKYKLKKEIKSKTNKEFFSYSWPLMFSGIIASIFYWVDSFSIGYFHNATQVGFYNAAIPIVSLMSFFPKLFFQLFFPLINKEFSRKNFKIIKELSQQIGKWIFIFNLPLFLIMIVFPGTIINILFGKTYLVAQNALRILAIGGLCSTLVFISENLVSMVGKSKLLLGNVIIASIINLILNFILVPKYGINGAAISTTIVGVILSVTLLIEARYYTSIIPVRRKMMRILLVSLPPLLIIFYLKRLVEINFLSLILIGFLFVLSYVFLIFVTGCLDKNDLMILRSLKRKIMRNK